MRGCFPHGCELLFKFEVLKAFGEAKCDVGYRAGFLVTGMPIGNEQSGRDGSIKCTVAR
jgi:hypothetical protein